MITKRDRKILEFLREYKYVTLEQLEKMFFKETKQGYNIARRRMKALVDLGYILCNKSKINKKNIYRINDTLSKIKMPTESELIMLDLLAELMYLDFEIIDFVIKEEKNKFQDGYTKVKKNNKIANIYIDVQLTNMNHNLEYFKFNHLKEGKERKESKNNSSNVEEYIVLIISDKFYHDIKDIEFVKVRQVSTSLTGLEEILSF